jgi:hypothetical protein
MIHDPVLLPPADSELAQLVELMCDGAIDAPQRDRLESLLENDRDAKLFYVAYLDIHAQMQWMLRDKEMSNDQCPIFNDQFSFLNDPSPVPSPQSPIPPIIIQTLPDPSSTFFSSFIGDPLYSYLIAVVVVSVAVLVAAVLKVASNTEIAVSPPHSAVQDIQLPAPPKVEYVGRITGMVDCKWEGAGGWGPESDTHHSSFIIHHSLIPQSRVSLGDTFSLRSGLLEITYNTGAKVILQGPVTYKVESSASGYLSIGKLTARVEKGPEVRGQGSETSILHSSFINHHLFAVRTPTATVTDLGTEFGVEVQRNGSSEVHILKGVVDLVTLRGGRHLLLRADAVGGSDAKAARVEPDSSDQGGDRITMVTPEPQRFLRALPKPPAATRGEMVLVGNRFALSTEGWSASPAGTGLEYNRNSGNPGGCIQTQEYLGPDFFYFIASPEYCGDRSAAFGGQLKFDVFTTIFRSMPDVPETMATEPPLVILEGANLRIAADQTQSVERDKWNALSVPLSTAGKWYRLAEAGALEGKQVDRTPVSEAVIRAVLSDLRDVWIRAEYMHGLDLGRLDNVLLMTPPTAVEKTKPETLQPVKNENIKERR